MSSKPRRLVQCKAEIKREQNSTQVDWISAVVTRMWPKLV